MAITYSSSNKVLGAGRIFLDVLGADGVTYDGERYLGDTPGFTVSIATDKVEDYTSDGALAEKDVNVTTKVTRTGKITCKNVDAANLALFVMGSAGSKTQAATPVADEAINGVKKGRFYQLGVTAGNPTGVRNVSVTAVTGPGGTPVYVAGTDYDADPVAARIYIKPGGGIADASNLLVDYTPVAGTREQISTDSTGARFGRLRFIADNTVGVNRDLFGPRVQISPSGDLPFKSRDAIMQMEFDVEFLAPTDGSAALYLDGRPA